VPKTLIVPVDGSTTAERGLRVATQLAERLEACDVVVVSVDLDVAERQQPYVDSLLDRTETTTVDVRGECHAGDVAAVVARIAAREPDAAVCMTTRGRGRVAAPLLGSVATEVLRAVDGPTVLVGPKCDDDWWHEPPRLVACWAGDASNPILAPAAAYSDALGMELSLLCVFHPLDVQASVDPEAQFAPALEQLDRSTPVPTVALHEELPAYAIAQYARELPATLLALTTHARTGLGRAVLGSVALDVVHESPCPVLALRRP
jgi:nucleotide-binding universal stress UspA family protein